MISVKAIQSLFNPTNHALLFHSKQLPRKKSSFLLPCGCKSEDSNSEATPPDQGDTRKQELLARIAMLQTQKVRLTDYLDERSTYLTQFAEEANAEIDQIGENAFKELDQAGARQIMENIENQMQEFEETAELSRQEIKKNEKVVEDFEDQIEKERNEALFFKNLGQTVAPTAIDKAKARAETEKVKKIADENNAAGSKTRRNIYIAMIGVVVAGIVDSLAFSSTSDLRKVAVLGVILVGLLSQLIYEYIVSSGVEKKEDE